jgi:hypothetical protein
MTAFWDMVPCGLIDVDRCFRYACCLHHGTLLKRRSASTRLLHAMSQKAVIFMLASVRT